MVDVFTCLRARAWDCLPSVWCQANALGIEIVLLGIALVSGTPMVMRILSDHPARARIVSRLREDARHFGVDSMTEHETFEMFCSLFIIGGQHLLGGLLVVPALLQPQAQGLVLKMACVGALSELAYGAVANVCTPSGRRKRGGGRGLRSRHVQRWVWCAC